MSGLEKIIAIFCIVVCIAMCLVPMHRYADCKYCGTSVELGALQADNHWSEDGQVICDDCWLVHRR